MHRLNIYAEGELASVERLKDRRRLRALAFVRLQKGIEIKGAIYILNEYKFKT